MKNIFILFIWFVYSIPIHAHNQPIANDSRIDDPIELSKKIINEGTDTWSEKAKKRILETYGNSNLTNTTNTNYLLLESPSLVFDYYQGGFANSQELLDKELFIKILNQAGAMMLLDGIDDGLAKLVFPGYFYAILDMRDQNQA